MYNSMFNFRAVLLFVYIVYASRADWVEVPQIGEKKSYKVGNSFSALSHSGVFNGDQLKPLGMSVVSKPNQAWLDYQMDRFGVNVKAPNHSPVVNNVNGLVVTDRLGYSNKSVEATHQFSVPLNVYAGSPSVSAQDDNYDTIIEIQTKPQTNTKTTATIHHHNKVHVTALQSYKDQDPGEYDEEEDQKAAERVTTASPDLSDSDKLNAFQKFLRYMKSIQKNIILKASMSINEKINYLNRFKDVILLEIEDRIKSLWPDEKSEKEVEEDSGRRVKRGVWSDESFMAFPSNETSLMTINFLTFAVFLIKLVLKVINTIKSKHYTYNGLNINTMEAIKIGKARKIRSNPYARPQSQTATDFTTEAIQNFLHNYENKLKSS